MRVLLVSHLFPNSAGPDHGIWLYRLVKGCRRLGDDIRVINPDRVPGAFYRPDKWVRSFLEVLGFFGARSPVCEDVPSLHPSHGESVGLPGSLKHLPRWLATERAYLRLRRQGFVPDLVHCVTSYHSGSAALRIARSLGVPLVVTEISSPYSLETTPAYRRRVAATVLREARRIACTSRFMMTEVSREFPETAAKLDLVYFPTADELFSCRRRERQPGAARLVTVCLLSEQKGISFMLEAIAILKRDHFPVHWSIAGDGPLRPRLEDQASSLGLAAEVEFLGQVSNSSLRGVLEQANVFVLPSLHETQAVALVEGLAAGLPAVYTRCGGPEEFMNEGLGVAVEPRDPEGLARAVVDIWSRYHQFPADTVKAECRALFGEEVCAKRMSAVYESAVYESAVS